MILQARSSRLIAVLLAAVLAVGGVASVPSPALAADYVEVDIKKKLTRLQAFDMALIWAGTARDTSRSCATEILTGPLVKAVPVAGVWAGMLYTSLGASSACKVATHTAQTAQRLYSKRWNSPTFRIKITKIDLVWRRDVCRLQMWVSRTETADFKYLRPLRGGCDAGSGLERGLPEGTKGEPSESADLTPPMLHKPVVKLADPTSRGVSFSLSAEEAGSLSKMRVKVSGEDWRAWVPYSASGTVVLPDRYGLFTVWFQVQDAAGNMSLPRAADNVTREAAVDVVLRQIDNQGAVRSCGFLETDPCSDVVKRFRANITTTPLPDTGLLLKAWRSVNGTWVETDPSPLQRQAIVGSVTDFPLNANLMAGLWRFQVQVPRDVEEFTQFGSTGYQYLRISPPPDTTAPAITGTSLSHSDPAAEAVGFSLSATDNAGAVTHMRAIVNGAERPWGAYASSGSVVLPGYGTFGIGFQVKDAAGNVSAIHYAGSVTRLAAVGLTLNQIDNYGNVRSCGSTETNPCSDVVKKFRTTISSAVSPNANLLLKAWRNINGSWVETSTSPFMYQAINGRWVIDMEVTAGLMNGIWRFQAQVPTTAATQFGASGYQYLRID